MHFILNIDFRHCNSNQLKGTVDRRWAMSFAWQSDERIKWCFIQCVFHDWQFITQTNSNEKKTKKIIVSRDFRPVKLWRWWRDQFRIGWWIDVDCFGLWTFLLFVHWNSDPMKWIRNRRHLQRVTSFRLTTRRRSHFYISTQPLSRTRRPSSSSTSSSNETKKRRKRKDHKWSKWRLFHLFIFLDAKKTLVRFT